MNNDRIRELVEQAGFYMTEKNGQALAEFAELIVKDCMATCTEVSAQYLERRMNTTDFREKNLWAAGEQASNKIKSQIKLQFGVTE